MLLAAFLVLAGAAGTWLGLFPWHKNCGYSLSPEAKDGGYEVSQPANEVAERLKEAQNSFYRVEINAEPVVSHTDKKANLMISNSQEDQDLQVKLILDATGAEIYLSEVIQPGKRKAYVTMDNIPEVGEHKLTAVFYYLDRESGQAVGEVEAGLLMTVKP